MKLFSHTYRLVWILILATYSYANTLFLEVFQFYHIEEPQWLIWFGFLLMVFLVWEGNRWIEKWVQSRSLSVHPLLQQFLISLFLAAFVGWLVTFTLQRIFNVHPESAREVEMKLAIAFSLRVNLFLQCIHAFLFFIQQSKEKERESEKLKIIAADAELQRIKNQINPHFLFNNLNVLDQLIEEDKDKASEFLNEFADIYRYVLQASDLKTISLDDELAFTQRYFSLIQHKYGKAYQLNASVQHKEGYIIPLTLQVLIENAVQHNLGDEHDPVQIEITMDEQIRVTNNIRKKRYAKATNGRALHNLKEQYALITDSAIAIEETAQRFTVTIPIIEQQVP